MNYRSTNVIVQVGRSVIDANQRRIPKSLVSFSQNKHGPLANVSVLSTADEEVAFVCSRVRDLIRRGTSPNDIAVLCRIRGNILKQFTTRLREMGVPYATGQTRRLMLEVCYHNVHHADIVITL